VPTGSRSCRAVSMFGVAGRPETRTAHSVTTAGGRSRLGVHASPRYPSCRSQAHHHLVPVRSSAASTEYSATDPLFAVPRTCSCAPPADDGEAVHCSARLEPASVARARGHSLKFVAARSKSSCQRTQRYTEDRRRGRRGIGANRPSSKVALPCRKLFFLPSILAVHLPKRLACLDGTSSQRSGAAAGPVRDL